MPVTALVGRLEHMDTVKHKFSWLRLVAAIFVAFVASFVWYMMLFQWYFGFVGAYWCNVFIGFIGVFVGSLCFRRQHRFLGSVILLLGGVALDGMFEDSDDKVYPLSVCWVALGGLAAVGFYSQASGYKGHSINWLQGMGCSSWAAAFVTSSRTGTCSNALTLKICRIWDKLSSRRSSL